MATKSFAQTLQENRVLIFNSSKPEIAPKLAKYGVDSDYLSKGVSLYNEVISLSENQKKEYQEESLAYDKSLDLKKKCQEQLAKNRKLIKLASRSDSDLQNRIKINAPKERKIEAWIKQTIEFYNLVLNEPILLESINKYGITADSINNDISDINTLIAARNEAFSEKGQAQEATRIRDIKSEELDDYCYELKTIATVALDGEPQLLEMLGILVRS